MRGEVILFGTVLFVCGILFLMVVELIDEILLYGIYCIMFIALLIMLYGIISSKKMFYGIAAKSSFTSYNRYNTLCMHLVKFHTSRSDVVSDLIDESDVQYFCKGRKDVFGDAKKLD